MIYSYKWGPPVFGFGETSDACPRRVSLPKGHVGTAAQGGSQLTAASEEVAKIGKSRQIP